MEISKRSKKILIVCICIVLIGGISVGVGLGNKKTNKDSSSLSSEDNSFIQSKEESLAISSEYNQSKEDSLLSSNFSSSISLNSEVFSSLDNRLSLEEAEEVIKEIKEVQKNRDVITKAKLVTYIDESEVAISEYDLNTFSGYRYDIQANKEESYIFVKENTGYYCFLIDNAEESSQEKLYIRYNDLSQADLLVDKNNDFINQFKDVVKDVYNPVNVDINFEANNPKAIYYSNSKGHLRCEFASLDGSTYLYEWNNYLPFKFEAIKKDHVEKKIYLYEDFEVHTLLDLSSYTLLEEK